MSDEWYTPGKYIKAAREVMGSINLDPASCKRANETVQALRYYSKEENGLDQDWHGNIWLNPPFARSQTPGHKMNQGLWIQKLLKEYQYGHVLQAVLLTTCRPDTSWFAPLWNYPICFADHKVGFYLPEKGQVLQEHSHVHGTLFVYLGSQQHQFIEVFNRFGPVIPGNVAIRRQDPKPISIELWTSGSEALAV